MTNKTIAVVGLAAGVCAVAVIYCVSKKRTDEAELDEKMASIPSAPGTPYYLDYNMPKAVFGEFGALSANASGNDSGGISFGDINIGDMNSSRCKNNRVRNLVYSQQPDVMASNARSITPAPQVNSPALPEYVSTYLNTEGFGSLEPPKPEFTPLSWDCDSSVLSRAIKLIANDYGVSVDQLAAYYYGVTVVVKGGEKYERLVGFQNDMRMVNYQSMPNSFGALAGSIFQSRDPGRPIYETGIAKSGSQTIIGKFPNESAMASAVSKPVFKMSDLCDCVKYGKTPGMPGQGFCEDSSYINQATLQNAVKRILNVYG